MIRTFEALQEIQPGFNDPDSVQMLRISIPIEQIEEPDQVLREHNDILDRLAAIQGVRSVSFGSSAPLEGIDSRDLLFTEDTTSPQGHLPPTRTFRFIAPGYFQTLGTPLIAGRDFTWTDLYEHHNVAIVSENLAREIWKEPKMALGKRVRQDSTTPWRTVVGVVGDVHNEGMHVEAPKIAYWPVLDKNFGANDWTGRSVTFLLRSDRAATEGLLVEIRRGVWSVNKSVPLLLVRTLGEVYGQSMIRTSYTMVILAVAGAMALLLAIVGIYGVVSYAISLRTRELGIRMAVGAEASGLVRAFVLQGVTLAAFGILIGLGAAAGLSRLIGSLLFRTNPLDLTTYAAMAVAVLLVAIISCYLPARRVTAVNPTEALRTA
jgi:predicted permease